LLIGLTFCLASEASAACIDLKQANNLSFEGILNYRIFAGPPNYEDVRKGDAPEPTYILTLPEPICASGDEFVDQSDKFNEVQIFPESSDKAAQALSRDLRRLVGKRVIVEGTSPFGAHTGHHHAPLMLPITRISVASDPTESYGTAMTTVQAFYAALGAGNGEEAVKFVIPRSDRRDRYQQLRSASSMAIWPIRLRLLMWLPFVQASIAYATDMWRLVRDAVMENLSFGQSKSAGPI
jgi:hypothetical protein